MLFRSLGFRPGLVGGHCIGVDPYYFIYQAEKLGFHSQIILNGRIINDSMGAFVADRAILKMIEAGLAPKRSKVVILGLTFKENCPDCRNSKVEDIVKRLREYGIEPQIVDPWVSEEAARSEYGLELTSIDDVENADCVIIAVAHREFRELGVAGFGKLFGENKEKVLIDVKGICSTEELDKEGFIWWRL